MPERPNGAVSKTVVSSNGHRGFKSHSLRHSKGEPVPSTRGRRRAGVSAGALAAVLLSLLAAGLGLVPAAASARPTDADVAIQKQAVLRKTDLSSGWSSERRETSEAPPTEACAGWRAVSDDLEPLATQSPAFTQSEFTRASNSVVVLKKAKVAKQYLEIYRDPDVATCIEAMMKAAFAIPSIASLRVYVTPSNATPPGADEAAGFQVQLTATTVPTAQEPARTAVIHLDLLIARVGRALTNFTFSNLDEPLPEQGELVDAVIGRLEDAGV
jgi:hypothetical protein